MEFSTQEYWSELPIPTPGTLPDPGIKPMSLMSPALAGQFFTTTPSGKPFTGTIKALYRDYKSLNVNGGYKHYRLM